MKLKLLAIVLLLSSAAWSTITPVGGTSAGPVTASNSVYTLTFTYSPTAGHTVVILVPFSTSGLYPYCRDNNFHTVWPGPKVTNSSESLSSFYTIASSGATSYVCQWAQGVVSSISGMLYEFSGVLSVNPLLSGNTATGTGTTASFAVTTQDNNDYVVCGFSDSNATFSSLSGSNPETIGTQPTGVLFSQAVGSPGSSTCSANLSTSSAWLGIAIELRTVTNTQPWSMVQITPSGYPTPGVTQTVGCTRATAAGAMTCTWQVAPIGTSNVLIVGMISHVDNGGSSGGAEISLASIYDCTNSGGCNSLNSINSWTVPSACNTVSWDGVFGHAADSVASAYVLSSTSGANYITATTNSAPVNTQVLTLFLYELATTSPNILDFVNSQADNSASTTHTMTGVSLTGSSDPIIQFIGGGANQLPTSPYLISVEYSHYSTAYAVNQNSGAAPTWTGTTSVTAAGCAMAFTQQTIGGGVTLQGVNVNGAVVF